ncbi:MAG: ribosomal L7Ae/L30e/S12e/Gadd45 family protein [Candidatus Cloacimonetes bacterium]|nr:ribosomal L7Ae/L30e/S12e/Gadd45 family protein [Candidatus Cloacimonadota bacterium]
MEQKTEQKIIALMHMARKAGRLKLGANAAERAVTSGRATMLILAEDVGGSVKSKLMHRIKEMSVEVVTMSTKSALGRAFNISDTGIIAIEDKNIVNGIKSCIGKKH